MSEVKLANLNGIKFTNDLGGSTRQDHVVAKSLGDNGVGADDNVVSYRADPNDLGTRIDNHIIS